MNRSTTLRLVGVLAALAALGVVVLGGGAASAKPHKAKTTTVKMVQDGKDLFFDGPKTVEAGTTLKIDNTTNPKKIGPHTFSLVRKKDIPTTKSAIKACEKKLKKICGAIIKWHDVDLSTGIPGENPVEVGKDGWDREGSLKRKGDSWVALKKNETFAREVTAPAGKTLHYFCAVHPFMQGKIKVVD